MRTELYKIIAMPEFVNQREIRPDLHTILTFSENYFFSLNILAKYD